MSTKKKIMVGVSFFVFVLPMWVQSQMVGNPAGVKGKGEWTISATGTYMNQQVGNETAISRRILMKSSWGLASFLDVYGMIGAVQLDLKTPDVNFIDYEGKFRLGYGVGFNGAVLPLSGSQISLWVSGQALRYSSEGSFIEYADIFSREYKMHYDIREFMGSAGIVIPFQSFRIYAAGIGWATQRLESKNEYLEYVGVVNHIGQVDGEFRSGLWTGGVVGIELILPQRYTISLEGLFFNEENYHIMIGVSQTGRSDW
ncbi:hypothetical protein JW824_11670 [bacterium]|nr:hypothetical protein [bacterium]